MSAAAKRLFLLVGLWTAFAVATASAATGAVDPAWMASARDPGNLEALKAELAQRRALAGDREALPIALALAKASRTEADPSAAFALAALAADAAPGDAVIQWNAVRAAMRSTTHFGEAARHLFNAVRQAVADPWLLRELLSRLLVFLGLAAAMTALGLLAVSLPSVGGLFVHDLSDRFPRDFRRFFPLAVLTLGAALLLAAGAGIVILAFLPAFFAGPYLPKRIRIALFASLALVALFFPGLELAGRMGGLSGDRAWLVYRLQKGDAGADLAAEVERLFPEKGYKHAYFHALLSRRAGNLDAAEAWIARAEAEGLDKGLALNETATLRFLKNDLAGAAKAYAEKAQATPGDWEVFYNLSLVETARLELVAAEAALSKAKALNAAAMEKRQARETVLGGRIYPSFSSFPMAWIAQELDAIPENRSTWPRDLWRVLGFSHPAVGYWVLLALAALGFAYAWKADPLGLSRRCISCGVVKCPRCHRLVKDVNVCGACWALHHEAKKVDANSRQQLRGKITEHTKHSRKARRLGGYLLPGWSDFVHDGGVSACLLGLLWSASLAALAGVALFTPATLSWLLAPLALLGLAHALGAAAARRW